MYKQQRFKMQAIVAAALLASAAGTALADLDSAGREVELGLVQFWVAVDEAKKGGNGAANHFSRTEADCDALIAKGKQLGIEPSQVMNGAPDSYLFKSAPKKCAEYATWKLLVAGAVRLAETKQTHGISAYMKVGEVTGEWANAKGDRGRQCIVDMDALFASGTPSDMPINVGGDVVTLEEGKQRWCQGLVDWAAKFSVATDQVRDAEAAKIRDKYTKAGIKGERLAFLIKYDGAYPYGKGCDVVLDTPAKLKKAKVLFYWTTMLDGSSHTIHRYQFKGDKLVKHSSRDFSTQEAAYRWCK